MRAFVNRSFCSVKVLLIVIFLMPLIAIAHEYQTDADIVVVGDVHGAYAELVSILQHAQLVDNELNWIGENTQFVSTGDLMDRGPSSRKIMDLLIKLQRQAQERGGKVHVLLGNHEVLNLIGDWRYISAGEYKEFAGDESASMRARYFHTFSQSRDGVSQAELLAQFDQDFPKGFFARLEAFMPEGSYGKWLHQLPFVLKINEHLFTHGGLSVKTIAKDVDELNDLLSQELSNYTESWNKLISDGRLAATDDYSLRPSLLLSQRKTRTIRKFLAANQGLLFSADSPNWYRGNTMCHPLFEQQVLNEALSGMEASHLWVGHTSGSTVRQRFDNTLIMMDTGILKEAYGGEPIYARIYGARNIQNRNTAWVFINAGTGEFVQPSTVPNRRSINPYDMSDEELQRFLQTAAVTDQQKLSEGITNPYKVTLEQDGKIVYAIFKHFDSGYNNRSSTNIEIDRFQHELAAYKLDRIMEMNVVPVSVERTINNNRGALQPWIDDLISFNEMEEKSITYDGFCDYKRQRQMMDVFDYLISNQDRHLGNITFTSGDWQLWFIDHTRAFGTSRNRPKLIKKSDLTLTPKFRKRLELLDEERLSVLTPWLRSREIKAILKRRDLLLSGDA